MKVVAIVAIILIGVVMYAFFDLYLRENFPNGLWLVSKEQSAQSSNWLSNLLSGSETDSNSGNSTASTDYSNNSNSGPSNNYIPGTSTPKKEEPAKPVISPYYGLAEIQSVKAENSYHVSLITLSVRPRQGENINITGWTVKTRRGGAIIPQAMEYYQSSYIPHNIIIREYNTIYLIGAKSPLGSDRSFRLNTCFGYLSKSRNFYPSVYTSCPKLELEELYHLKPYCQDFLLRSYGCKMPDYSEDFKVSTDSQCVEYILDYFTYSGCYKNHYQEDNFLYDYWYVYLNRNIVEPLHDVIYLYDQNGLLIDEYIY